MRAANGMPSVRSHGPAPVGKLACPQLFAFLPEKPETRQYASSFASDNQAANSPGFGSPAACACTAQIPSAACSPVNPDAATSGQLPRFPLLPVDVANAYNV